MKKKDIIKLIKETVAEGRKHYGVHDTYGASPRQRRNLSGLPGVMEDENLKEFTDYGQEGIYPKKEKPGDMFRQKEVEDLFPKGMASRSDKAFQARLKQHADWTEQSAYNNTFVHMQYHETKGLEDEYFIYQTQHYNTNYDDFRSPKFTLLSITKNKDTEKEEDLGEYIVDTGAYIKDLEALRSKGVLGDRVMESPLFRTGVKMDMAPKEMAPRIKKVFDMVNGAKSSVQTPEFWKNFFKSRYGIPFPENLKNITMKQALAMNKFGNDMKNNIKERQNINPMGIGAIETITDEILNILNGALMSQSIQPDVAENIKNVLRDYSEQDITEDISDDISKAEDEVQKATQAKADAEVKVADLRKKKADGEKGALEEDNMDHDDEGRMAKSQMYKMKTYVDKLSQMLDDGAQLPSWVQAKVTKASSMMSAVFHYLDYEMVRNQDNLMEHMDKYKKRAVLMEGAMKRLFVMFDDGMTDEEIVQDHAMKGVEVPEAFISRARKQYESLKKAELDMEMAEKEYKNSTRDIVNNAAGTEVGMEPPMEEKQLASGLK